jgi:GT2 family glycosyltransferase
VYDARNTLVKQALQENFDRILWLDSDMDFQPDLLVRLGQTMDETGADIVSGLYFTRRAPVKPVIYNELGYYHDPEANEVTPHAGSYENYPIDSVFPIEGCGFGAVLMTVDIARKVVDKFGVPFAPIVGFGEDLSFCLRAEEVGGKIVCDSRVKLGHVGLGTISEATYLSTRVVKNE